MGSTSNSSISIRISSETASIEKHTCGSPIDLKSNNEMFIQNIKRLQKLLIKGDFISEIWTKSYLQGFINIGNSCYMNSALSLLFSVNDLINYFISELFLSDRVNFLVKLYANMKDTLSIEILKIALEFVMVNKVQDQPLYLFDIKSFICAQSTEVSCFMIKLLVCQLFST